MKILIAVPVFNEEQYVTRVLREIRKYARATAASQRVDVRIVVIDDGSTDRTPELLRDLAAKGHIHLITHPENRGYGQSLIDAFAFASKNGYDWTITMDCDEQHEPCRIPLFVEACLKDDADIISGSRYMQTAAAGDAPPPDRRNINKVITDLINSTLTLNLVDTPQLTDSFCGFKAHRTAAMEKLNLTIPGYAFPMQFWVEAMAQGLRIRELPVRLIYKDATRHFGGLLDDPAVRLDHYMTIFTRALTTARQSPALVAANSECAACCDL